MRKTPTPGTIAALIAERGIEVLRGLPLEEYAGGPTVYVSNELIDKMVAEAKDDDELQGDTRPMWNHRLYGGATPDADMVTWIYPNVTRTAPAAPEPGNAAGNEEPPATPAP